MTARQSTPIELKHEPRNLFPSGGSHAITIPKAIVQAALEEAKRFGSDEVDPSGLSATWTDAVADSFGAQATLRIGRKYGIPARPATDADWAEAASEAVADFYGHLCIYPGMDPDAAAARVLERWDDGIIQEHAARRHLPMLKWDDEEARDALEATIAESPFVVEDDGGCEGWCLVKTPETVLFAKHVTEMRRKAVGDEVWDEMVAQM